MPITVRLTYLPHRTVVNPNNLESLLKTATTHKQRLPIGRNTDHARSAAMRILQSWIDEIGRENVLSGSITYETRKRREILHSL